MYLPIIERFWNRTPRSREPRAAPPHCVRCGRGFVASGLDERSLCWFCARSVELVESPEL